MVVTCEDVIKAIHRVKSGKFDSDGLSSEHLRFACPVIADSLASLFKDMVICLIVHCLFKTWLYAERYSGLHPDPCS